MKLKLSVIALFFIITSTALADSLPNTLDLQTFVNLVKKNNQRILSQKLEWDTSLEAVKNAESIFEPEFSASSEIQNKKARYTSEEFNQNNNFNLSAGGSNIKTNRDEQNITYNTAIDTLIPTGARVQFSSTLADISNAFNKASGDEYQLLMGLAVTQPLLKNAGTEITKANIHIAEWDTYIAFQSYRQELMDVITKSSMSFWDLYLSQKRLDIRRESIHIAEKVLADNRARVDTGKMAATEVMDAEAEVLLRKTLEKAAMQDLVEKRNNLLIYISSTENEYKDTINVSQKMMTDKITIDYDQSLKNSFMMRPEYLSAHKKIEKENVRIAYAKNQRLPQLDLKASYGLNGLEKDVERSWSSTTSRDFESWSLGLQLTVPLTGGIKSKSELAAAKNRKKQALLELAAVEIALKNSIDTIVKYVDSVYTQAQDYKNVALLNKRLLETEMLKLEGGKSTSRNVFDREEKLIKSLDAEIESMVNYQKAVIALKTTEGTILNEYNIDIAEVSK